MKKTILLLSVLCLGVSASYAQISQGRVQVGGSVGIIHQKQESGSSNPDSRYTNLVVTPSVGRFYKTNKLAGLFLNFAYSDGQDFNGNRTTNRIYGGGLFLRQYQPVLNKLYVFLEERGGYSYASLDNNNSKSHYYSIDAAVQAGMAYDITKKMQLEISLNNLVSAYYQKGANLENYGISTSLEKNVFSNIGFGFRYYLK